MCTNVHCKPGVNGVLRSRAAVPLHGLLRASAVTYLICHRTTRGLHIQIFHALVQSRCNYLLESDFYLSRLLDQYLGIS